MSTSSIIELYHKVPSVVNEVGAVGELVTVKITQLLAIKSCE